MHVNLRDLSVVIGKNCSDFAHCFTVAPPPSIPRSTVPKEATRTSVLGRKLAQIYRTRRDPDTTWSCTTGRRITGSQPDNEQLYFQRLVPDRNGHREWDSVGTAQCAPLQRKKRTTEQHDPRAHTALHEAHGPMLSILRADARTHTGRRRRRRRCTRSRTAG